MMLVSGKILQLTGKDQSKGGEERTIDKWVPTQGWSLLDMSPWSLPAHPGPQNPHLKEGDVDLRNVLSERPFQIWHLGVGWAALDNSISQQVYIRMAP